MAGSRGRGRSQFTFNVDALGFGRGDSLPTSAHTPSPLFPPMQFKPVPLHTGEEVDYMLALKQELRASSKNLPFHIKAARAKTDVARYSDKYHNGEPKNCIDWSPDWSRMPKELCIKVRKPCKTGAKPQLTRKPKVASGKEEVLQKLETLEKREEEQHSEEEEDEEKKKQNDEEEPDADQDYDEEEREDETDYIMSYFDNGEDFGADSDDNMDEAVY